MKTSKLNVVFTINKEEMVDSIVSLTNKDSYFAVEASKKVLSEHTELKKADLSNKTALGDYVDSFLAKHADECTYVQKLYSKSWKKVETDVGTFLSKILKTDLEDLNNVKANIGIIQIYPRDLYEKTLSVHYQQYPYFTNSIVLHEVTHFILAKKWLELFPEDSLDMLDAPHAFWHLSEILVPIFNSEEKIRQLIPEAECKGYEEYDKPFNEDEPEVSIYGYFLKNYIQYKKDNRGIDDFLKFARDEIQKKY